MLDASLQAQYGLTLKEIQTGVMTTGEKVNETLLEKIWEKLPKGIDSETNGNARIEFNIIGKREGDIVIYHVRAGERPDRISHRPFKSVGSGSDNADAYLNRFNKRLPRDRRTNIPPIVGMGALLVATSHARLNLGVGGVPNVAFYDEDSPFEEKAYFLGADESQLALQLADLGDVGILKRSDVKRGLKELIVERDSCEPVFGKYIGGNNRAVDHLLGYECS